MEITKVKSSEFKELNYSERGDTARKKLIEASLKIFSEVGYDAAATRDIAAAAGVNIAAIPYYFRSKEGLYFAVIDYIISYYRKRIGVGLAAIKQALLDKDLKPQDYHAILNDYMRSLIRFILEDDPEHSQISHIYMREQLDPTIAFDRLYENFVKDMQGTMTTLVSRVISNQDSTSKVKIITQSILSHISLFNSSRKIVLRNLGWDNYEENKATEIEQIVIAHIDAIIEAHQKEGLIS